MYSMGAHLDLTRRPYSFLGNSRADSTEAGASQILFWRNWSLTKKESVPDSSRKSWSVCPHLSSFEGLFDYYMASGPIMILLGKCFCHDCYGKALSRGGLAEFMESCQHMTDRNFQVRFHPSIYSRYYWMPLLSIEKSLPFVPGHLIKEVQDENTRPRCRSKK